VKVEITKTSINCVGAVRYKKVSSGVSQLVHVASMLSFPTSVIKDVQTELFSFLWKNKKDEVKRMVSYQPSAEGGLNFVNFPAVVKSLRLAWLSRLLSHSSDAWKKFQIIISPHIMWWLTISSHMQLQCCLYTQFFTYLLSGASAVFSRI